MQVSTILRGVHRDDHDFASYYTFSLAVANDAENAQTNRVCRKDHVYQI